MFGYVRKEDVCKLILDELTAINAEYRALTEKKDVDEQRKRDAFMMQSGQVYITTRIINRLRGEKI